MFGAAWAEMKTFFENLEDKWMREVSGKTVETPLGPKTCAPPEYDLWMLKIGLDIITQLTKGIADALPTMIPQIIAVIMEIVDVLTDPKQLNTLIDAAFQIIDALIDGLLSEDSINAMVEKVPEVVVHIVEVLINSVDKLLDAALKIIKALCDYFMDPDNKEKIKKAAGDILDALGNGLTELVSNLLPFIKQVATAWAEMFIGEIDYDDTAWEIIQRLGAAFIHNMKTGGIIGKWLRGDDDDAGSSGGGTHFATGGIVSAPTRALIGENGAEAILPLENNTSWMDVLAAKIAGAGSAGVTIGEINVEVSGASGIDNIGGKIVEKIDEALKNYQIQQNRGIGGAW